MIKKSCINVCSRLGAETGMVGVSWLSGDAMAHSFDLSSPANLIDVVQEIGWIFVNPDGARLPQFL